MSAIISILLAVIVAPLLTLIVSKNVYRGSRRAFKASVFSCLLASSFVCLAMAARIAFNSATMNTFALAVAYASVWYLLAATGAIKHALAKVTTQIVLGPIAIFAAVCAVIVALIRQSPDPIFFQRYSEALSCRVYVVGSASNGEPLIEAEVHLHTPWLPGIHRLVHVQAFSESSTQPTPSEACTTASPWAI
jgi:hypothetical protein